MSRLESHTPARGQAGRRRQQLIPLPQPSSCGRDAHCIPVFSTNTIPVRQARSGTRARPGCRGSFGRWGGTSGATTAHRASLTSGLARRSAAHDPGHLC